MWPKCIWFNFTVFFIIRVNCQLELSAGVILNEKSTIQITRSLRTYRQGPIDGNFFVTEYDDIVLTAGRIPGVAEALHTSQNYTGKIRQWTLLKNGTGEPCSMVRVYNFGEEVLFKCGIPGIYRAFVEEVVYDWKTLKAENAMDLNPKKVDYPEMKLYWSNRYRLTPFKIPNPKDAGGKDLTGEKLWMHFKDRTGIAKSDPFSVDPSDYCYYWNYRITAGRSSGKVVGSVIADSDRKGSKTQYDIHVWIIEPSSTTYDEISVHDPNRPSTVSEYSRVVTKRFYEKGLVPCVRRAHGAVEVVQIKWFHEDDPANTEYYPYWKISIVLHLDTVISTLADITFTVSSRQRVSLYNCFVGDTRLFLNEHKFEYIQYGENKISEALNLDFSRIGRDRKDYILGNFNYIYGHALAWEGDSNSRAFQPGTWRTDLLTIKNPCKSQEFLAIAGGSLYVASDLLERRMENVQRVRVPGLSPSEKHKPKGQTSVDNFAATDAGFTPAHLVILLPDASVYLLPYDLKTKGVGYIIETRKYRIGSLVKRRWCAQTGYLTHNMLVPAFSSTGNIILIQMFPIEGSVNIWSRPGSESCAAENQGFVGFVSDDYAYEESLRNETEIHLHERVAKSDEVGRLIPPVKAEKMNKSPPIAKFMEEEETFLSNNGTILDDHDPHFSEKAINPASKRLGTNFTNYNVAVIYVLDNLGTKIKTILKENGINIKTASGPDERVFEIDNVQFTAVEKRFLIVSRFKCVEIPSDPPGTDPTISGTRNFITMISLMSALNYPVKIIEKVSNDDNDVELDTFEVFPGCLLVRKKEFQETIEFPLHGDQYDPDLHVKGKKTPYPLIISTLNTALPTYVVDLGDVYVFASIDGRFARPLAYYKREEILKGILHEKESSTPRFTVSEGVRHDIVVTEQGILSVLWRKMPQAYNKGPEVESQGIAIGSVNTIEPLRQMKPFSSETRVFQWVTPDNEILYGKFTMYLRPRYFSCDSPQGKDKANFKNAEKHGCIMQPTKPDSDIIPKRNVTAVLCTSENWDFKFTGAKGADTPVAPYFDCKAFKLFPYEDDFDKITDPSLKKRIESFKTVMEEDNTLEELKYCNDTALTADEKSRKGCFLKYPDRQGLCEANKDVKFPACTYPYPKLLSIYDLHSIELLGTPYYNLLKGSMHYADDVIAVSAESTDTTCPYSGFKVIKTDFDYAEIGYSTRITAKVSYFGKNIPLEADLLIEFENVVGIKVDIASKTTRDRDQTTVTKTMDIDFQMTDTDFRKMEKFHQKKSAVVEEGQKDDARIFSITIRPSIVNLYCNKDEIFTTLQINVGCNPFSKMRLIAEATPLNRITLKTERSGDAKAWVTEGNFLTVPREDVHHRQRKLFKCKEKNETLCTIPYANLYGVNVFNISWRDTLFPVFEQFLTGYTRRVTGNLAIYDLLGEFVGLNLTRLDAQCYNNANKWYRKLLGQQIHLGKNISVHEDIYRFYKDCYDHSLPRETPKLLSSESYRLHNLTNRNSIKFSRKPNPRNKIYIFRAVVVNTYYNRFTFCPNLDTIFLVKIVGIPTPRQALPWQYSLAITMVILVILAFTYIHFSFCYPWKGDASDSKTGGSGAVNENVADDILNEEYLRDEEHIEFDFTQRVRTSDGFFERFAKKIYALTKWRRKAVERVEQHNVEEKKEN